MRVFMNNFSRRLTLAANDSTTALKVAIEGLSAFTLDPGNFVAMTLEDGETREIVHCTAVDPVTGELTVLRGQEGTTPASWALASKIQARLTAEGLADVAVMNIYPSAGAPVGAPPRAAVLVADTVGRAAYVSVGTGTEDDWLLIAQAPPTYPAFDPGDGGYDGNFYLIEDENGEKSKIGFKTAAAKAAMTDTPRGDGLRYFEFDVDFNQAFYEGTYFGSMYAALRFFEGDQGIYLEAGASNITARVAQPGGGGTVIADDIPLTGHLTLRFYVDFTLRKMALGVIRWDSDPDDGTVEWLGGVDPTTSMSAAIDIPATGTGKPNIFLDYAPADTSTENTIVFASRLAMCDKTSDIGAAIGWDETVA